PLSARFIDLEAIATPRADWFTIPVGVPDLELVAAAERMRFDQVPVISADGACVGLIALPALKQKSALGAAITVSDCDITARHIGMTPDLETLLEAIGTHRALIAGSGELEYLVTISDLNKHGLRSHIYPILAEFEVLMARWVDAYHDGTDDWIGLFGSDMQTRIRERWESDRNKSIDISPINFLHLTELIRIVGKTSAMRTKLDILTASRFDNLTGPIGKVRNAIMHPVRPLIASTAEVLKLLDTLRRVTLLADRVHAQLFSQAGPGQGTHELRTTPA
ncbi:MAG TPA: hypothetical protein PK819_04100, partial [Thermomicrobiales bacterium]|nr:hypothetical protein [Thermomicrobiales bacterium]